MCVMYFFCYYDVGHGSYCSIYSYYYYYYTTTPATPYYYCYYNHDGCLLLRLLPSFRHYHCYFEDDNGYGDGLVPDTRNPVLCH